MRTPNAEYYRSQGWGDRSEAFQEWMDDLDNQCCNMIGLSIHDLPDQPFADMYEDGEDPYNALIIILETEGFPLD